MITLIHVRIAPEQCAVFQYRLVVQRQAYRYFFGFQRYRYMTRAVRKSHFHDSRDFVNVSTWCYAVAV